MSHTAQKPVSEGRRILRCKPVVGYSPGALNTEDPGSDYVWALLVVILILLLLGICSAGSAADYHLLRKGSARVLLFDRSGRAVPSPRKDMYWPVPVRQLEIVTDPDAIALGSACRERVARNRSDIREFDCLVF